MVLLKKLSLTLLGLAFFVGLYVASAEAQRYSRYGSYDRSYYGDSGSRYRRSSYRNGSWSRYNRYGYLSPSERRRLARQRYRLYNTRNRYYYNDGRISWRERRKLAKRYAKYRRSAYRSYRW